MRAPHVAMRMAAILAVITGGCDGASEPSSHPVHPPVAPPSVPTYRTITEGPVGSVSGTVRWRGEPPPSIEIEATSPGGPCGGMHRVTSMRLGAGGAIEGAVIVVEGIREGRLPMGGELALHFAGCALAPVVAAVSTGTTLRFQNDEGVLHNVRIVGDGEAWLDVALPDRGASAEAVARRGIHRITDDAAHPWIEGYLVVVDHPYVAVTNGEGRFSLPRVPVGSYQIRLWHPGLANAAEPTASGRPGRGAPIVLLRPLAVSEGNDSPTDFELDASSFEAAGALMP